MVFGTTASEAALQTGTWVGRASNPKRFLNACVWLLTLGFILGMKPSEANAVKQKSAKKEVSKPKAKPAGSSTGQVRAPARNPLLRQPILPPLDPDGREYVVAKTRSGDTIGTILSRFQIAQAERSLWERSIRRDIGNRAIPAGKDIHLYFAKTSTGNRQSYSGQLKAVEIDDNNEALALTWEKGIRGILFQRREKPYDVELKAVSGIVEASLLEDGRKAGIHPALMSQLTDIFTWDIDLEKDVRKGDSFKILYEQRSRKGQEASRGLRILAAELVNAGHKMTAIYFEKQKGQGNYYNSEGRSLARSFLRFPLEFAAITSHFTESRFHPLLRANLPHTGVDFAAQRGTPVRAVGDGMIVEAGWNGGYGKAIDIKHDATYMSRYAHLDRFADGIKPGSTVSKGQLIGYVGSTGRATGPHLHFELYKDQQYVNPLSVDFPADETIEPDLLKMFENQMKTYLVELAGIAPNS
jgi:murein DD-endopeptidase MepM/ murein hydrolase activator NlpD